MPAERRTAALTLWTPVYCLLCTTTHILAKTAVHLADESKQTSLFAEPLCGLGLAEQEQTSELTDPHSWWAHLQCVHTWSAECVNQKLDPTNLVVSCWKRSCSQASSVSIRNSFYRRKKRSGRAMIIILQCLSKSITQTIYPSTWSVKRLQGGGRPPCPCFNGSVRWESRLCVVVLFHFLHSQVWAAVLR